MNDDLVKKIALLVLLAIIVWTVLFWKVPICDIVKCAILGHLVTVAFFATISVALSYRLGVPLLSGDHLFAITIGLAPVIGGYLHHRQRK